MQNKLVKPKISKALIQLPTQPTTPLHVGIALKDTLMSYWIDCIFRCYDKMHDYGTLSCLFPKYDQPLNIK